MVACEPLKSLALRKFLRAAGIAEYKLPDRFEFVVQLPLTAVGKTDKARLRAQLQTLLRASCA
ncbi:Enterobactin synthase component E [compost metagenome]